MIAAAIRADDDLDTVFRRIKAQHAEALIVYPDALTFVLRDPIMTRAIAHGLPTLVTADLSFRDALIVFGPHIAEMPARAAGFVDRILRGAKPSDLPIEQPPKYDLKIDLRVASKLGVKIPLSLLL
jgi:putative ABC transport system substrate-binding protein